MINTDTPTPRGVRDAMRAATTETGIAEAWIGARSCRDDWFVIERIMVIEAWIDAQSRLGDDGK